MRPMFDNAGRSNFVLGDDDGDALAGFHCLSDAVDESFEIFAPITYRSRYEQVAHHYCRLLARCVEGMTGNEYSLVS